MRRIGLVFLGFVLACATPPRAIDPTWPLHKVELPTLRARAQVRAVRAPTVEVEADGDVVVEIDIGEAEPVVCFVKAESITLAPRLAKSLDWASLQNDFVSAEVSAIELAGTRPVLVLALGYLPPSAGVLEGRTMRAAYASGPMSVVCSHDHRDTGTVFQAVVRDLTGSLVRDAVQATPVFDEVLLVREGDRIVGFSQSSVFPLADGFRVEASTVVLLPKPEGPPEPVETWRVEETDATGRLVRAHAVTLVGKRNLVDAWLQSDGANRYRVKRGGDEVAWESETPVEGAIELQAKLRAVKADGVSRTRRMWSPGNGSAPSRVDVLRAEDGGQVVVETGDSKVSLQLDDQGTRSLTMTIGTHAVRATRLVSNGAWPLPKQRNP